MKHKVGEFVDRFQGFHELSASDQIARLVFFHTVLEGRETISTEELERLFGFASLPVPKNLDKLLAYLCVGPEVKEKEGLRDKLNYCIGSADKFSKSVRDALRHLHGAKLTGDIVAHHSKILLDRTDVELQIANFRMLIKEVSTI